jgi:DNA primase
LGSDVLPTGDNLTGEWFTYRQAAELLSVSTEAVRQRAKRGRWQKTLGNDKRTRIRPPEGWNDIVRVSDDRSLRARVVDERALANQVIRALEAHIETLKAQLTAAEQRAEKQAAEFAAREMRHAADLAVERTLADRMSARVDQMTADLAVEQAQRVDAEKRLAAGSRAAGLSVGRLTPGSPLSAQAHICVTSKTASYTRERIELALRRSQCDARHSAVASGVVKTPPGLKDIFSRRPSTAGEDAEGLRYGGHDGWHQ